jgi:hypothetical protein
MEASFQLHVLATLIPENSLRQTFFISYGLAYLLFYNQDNASLLILPNSDNFSDDDNPFPALFPTHIKHLKKIGRRYLTQLSTVMFAYTRRVKC